MRCRSVLCLAALLCLFSCRSLRDPQQACELFLAAVREGDATALFDTLLQTTQWSLYTVAKQQQQMRQLIEGSYPPAERSSALARLQGPGSGDGKDLFRTLYPHRYGTEFQRRLGTGPVTVHEEGPDLMTCGRAAGQPFHFARAATGKWGLSELDSEWELAKLRAVHDLETVRDNARLYQKGPPEKR